MDDTEENGSLMRASDRACDDANDVRRLELRQHRHLPYAEQTYNSKLSISIRKQVSIENAAKSYACKQVAIMRASKIITKC